MKIFRSTLVAVVATVVAACGDKVNVQAPVNTTTTVTATSTATATATPKVNSVTVTPATATLTVGQTITLTAAVNADAGLATTVTWSTSDATLATVSTAGVVTAVKATAGVSICATSTVDTGKKGCGAVVITAASATVPATASIAGVFQTNLTTPVTPSNVSGTIFAQVNINPGTQVVQRVVLLVGSVRADSQVFSAAQSAALRYAADQAGVSKDVAQPTVVLTANTAAYNATTGAVTYANASGQTIKAELWVTGATTASSTASYASSLTLNNTDVVYGAYTNPSTTVNATDASGYQWTGFGAGTTSLKVVPVTYTGKTASSVTVAYGSAVSATVGYLNATSTYCAVTPSTSCIALPAGADTALTKTVTGTAPYTATFGLYDHAFVAGSTTNTLATGIAPTVTINYTDGSSVAAAAFTNATSLGFRPDNQGPANPTIANPAFNASTTVMRGVVSFAIRPTLTSLSTVADSGKLITAVPADIGVSAGATTTVLNGMTFKAFRNAGGTAVSATDTLLATTEITAGTSLSTLAETGAYCVQLRAYDALGNVSPSNNNTFVNAAGVQVAKGCSTATGQRSTKLDNTAPVVAFSGLANGDWSATDTATASAFTAGAVNYFYTIADNNVGTDSVLVCYYQNVANVMTAAEYIGGASGTACARRVAGTGTGTNKAITSATAQLNQITSAGTLGGNPGQIVISVQSYDAAGNIGNRVTRIVLYDAVVPTASVATLPSVLLGDAPAVASFLNDGMSIANYAAEIVNNTTLAYASNVASHVGTYATSANAVGNTPVLRTAYTATTDAISTSPYTKFLNQAVSVTVPAIQYLVRANAAATGSVSEQADALLAAATGYRIHALDQAGNASATSLAFSAPTITNLFNVAALAGAASSPIAGGSGAFTSVALDGAFAYSTDFAAGASAVSGGKVLSSSVRVKVSYYTKHDQTSAFWNNKVSATGWVYCAGRTTAVGGSPIMNGTSAVSESPTIQSVTAPAVDLYLPVRAQNATQPTFQYYGTASVISSTTVTGTPGKNCGDIITSTYALTVTPSDRTFQPYTSGSALWVVRQSNGFASVLPMGIGYSR